MELRGDEFEDNSGGAVAMVNIPVNENQPNIESPLSAQEEELSDPDLQDEESGEQFPQQPLPNTNTMHPALTNYIVQNNPLFLANLKEHSPEMKATMKVMGNGFPLAFPFVPALHQAQPVLNNHILPNAAIAAHDPTPGTSSSTSPRSECSHASLRNGSVEPRPQGEGPSNAQNNNPAAPLPNQQNNNAVQPAQNQPQQNWSFEEQFKQLYEISDDPERKIFLDKLFTFMQEQGKPIARLPIMAKSVLDLYELYNLVIARGGLVDVINKKLWQEIIKGLHLPSSITSAAFTLRTQYMKYLYTFECATRNLSTPADLKAAIEGNRREGRRSSGNFVANFPVNNMDITQRNARPQSAIGLQPQMNSIPMVGHHGQLVNGNGPHGPHSHLPHHLQHAMPQSIPGTPNGITVNERVTEYMKILNKEGFARHLEGTSSPIMHHQGSPSPTSMTPPRDVTAVFNSLDVSRFWSMYHNNNNNNILYTQPALTSGQQLSPINTVPTPEPQREALDLGVRTSNASSPARNSPSSGTSAKRDLDYADHDIPVKRSRSDDENPEKVNASTHIKIASRACKMKTKDGSLEVSIDINGVIYQGILFPKDNDCSPSTSNGNTKLSRNMPS